MLSNVIVEDTVYVCAQIYAYKRQWCIIQLFSVVVCMKSIVYQQICDNVVSCIRLHRCAKCGVCLHYCGIVYKQIVWVVLCEVYWCTKVRVSILIMS